MLPSHLGIGEPGPRGFPQYLQLLVDGNPSTALNTRINLNTLCARRNSGMTRLRLAPIYDSTVLSKWGCSSGGVTPNNSN